VGDSGEAGRPPPVPFRGPPSPQGGGTVSTAHDATTFGSRGRPRPRSAMMFF
jgi:hypothetical protein